jgi:competence protein ComEC
MRYLLASHPSVRLLACAVAGILSGMALPLDPAVWLGIAVSTSLSSLLFAIPWRHRIVYGAPEWPGVASYLLALVAAFALYSSTRFHFSPSPSLLSWSGREVILSGMVEGRPDRAPGGTGFRMRVTGLFHDGRHRHLDDRAKVFVRVPKESDFLLEEGDVVRVKGRPGLISRAANLDEYDPRLQARYRGVHVQLYCSGPWGVLREPPEKGFTLCGSIVNPLRRYLAGCIDGSFPTGREGQFVKGMILGDRELLPEELGEAFRRTGTAHVIAVSGLHVALLALAVNLCLQRLKVTKTGRLAAFILFVAVLATYSFVTGNAPSIRRAAIMSAVMIGGGVLGRKTFAINSLAASDLLILLADPFDLFNAGFLMTNAAVLGILLIHPRLSTLLQFSGGVSGRAAATLWSSFSVSISAMAGVSPVIAFFFGTFSPSGIVANLPVVLFSNLAMYAALPLFLFEGVAGWLAVPFGLSSWLFARFTILSTMFFGSLPFASVELRPDLFEVAVFYVALGGVLYAFAHRRWGRVAILLLAGANLVSWRGLMNPAPKSPAMLTVNLGRQVAVLFTSGSETVLVDAGPSGRGWERILRQAELRGVAHPVAAVSFLSPDSALGGLPVRRRLDASETSMVLGTIVVTRPAERVLRIESRRRSLLMVSGMGRLVETRGRPGEVAMVWIYRFTGKQWHELDQWMAAYRPGRVVLVEGPFMSTAQRGLLARFAAVRHVVTVRSKSRQTVLP